MTNRSYPVAALTINGMDIRRYVISYNGTAGGVLAKAAAELQEYLRQTTGVSLPIRTAKTDDEPRILLHETMVTGTDSIFKVISDEHGLVISGDAKRGMIYAVYHFLETFLGWRFFSSDTEVCYEAESVDLSNIDYTYEHAFKIRDIDSFDFANLGISAKRYQNGNGRRGPMTEYGGPVCYCPNGIHTFHILNEDEQEVDQPCLNDAGVQGRFVKNIRRFLDENWEKQEIKSVHVSQNDNQRYCKCPACLADIEKYGTPAGSIIKMCNLIAEDLETYRDGKYEDVYIITFAYQYSLDCPTNIRCHPKVMVEYAIIDCCHQHALNDPDCVGSDEAAGPYNLHTRSNVQVMEEMRKWAKISDHCYLYDYGAAFRYYYGLFPNIDILYENYKVLNEIGAWGYVILCNAQSPSAEFGALRDYLICKLTEEPGMTKEEYLSHIDEFLRAYYGNAWEYAKEYLLFTQKLADDHGACFGVYNSPEWVFGVRAFAEHGDRLTELFDKAMGTEGLTETELLHVRRLRTSAEYLRLGAIHKAEMESGDPARVKAQTEAIKDFHRSLLEIGQDWADESAKLPEEIDETENVRAWLNFTGRHFYED